MAVLYWRVWGDYDTNGIKNNNTTITCSCSRRALALKSYFSALRLAVLWILLLLLLPLYLTQQSSTSLAAKRLLATSRITAITWGSVLAKQAIQVLGGSEDVASGRTSSSCQNNSRRLWPRLLLCLPMHTARPVLLAPQLTTRMTRRSSRLSPGTCMASRTSSTAFWPKGTTSCFYRRPMSLSMRLALQD